MIRRLFPHPGLSAMLVVVWMLLVNAFTFGALFLALVFGVLVPLSISRFWPDQRNSGRSRGPRPKRASAGGAGIER